jgi:hypothetical protein
MRPIARPLPLLAAGLAAALAASLALAASQVRVIPVLPAPAAPTVSATPVGVDTSALTERVALDPAFLELRAQVSALRRDHAAQQRQIEALRACVAELAMHAAPGKLALSTAPLAAPRDGSAFSSAQRAPVGAQSAPQPFDACR